MTRKTAGTIDPIEQLDQSLTFLQDQRTQQLLTAYQYQVIDHQALDRERTRLSQKYGDGHPRVQAMTARLAHNKTLFKAMEQEISRSETRQAPLPKGGWRVQGRVVDASEKPLPEKTVFLAGSRRKPLEELGYACTDKGGQYTITLNTEQVANYQDQPLYMLVSDDEQGQAEEPLRAVADTVALRDIHVGGKQQNCDPPFTEMETDNEEKTE